MSTIKRYDNMFRACSMKWLKIESKKEKCKGNSSRHRASEYIFFKLYFFLLPFYFLICSSGREGVVKHMPAKSGRLEDQNILQQAFFEF